MVWFYLVKLKNEIEFIFIHYITELKDKVESSEGSGKEIDQVEQLDDLLNQSAKVLNKNCDSEETDVSTNSKQEIDHFHLLIVGTLT